MDLPANMRIARVEANATPADRSGTLVSFGITPVRAAQVILVDNQGKPIPEGSMAYAINETGQSSVVGFDGMTGSTRWNSTTRYALRQTPAVVACNLTIPLPQKGLCK